MLTLKHKSRITRRQALAAVGALLGAPAIGRAQGQAGGAALVIGNSHYQWEATLPNVRRDAPDMAKRFQALGLKTELVQDASQDAMRAAINKFATGCRGANLAAFYFAGHGASWAKDTYLVPVDADLSNPSTVQTLIPSPSVGKAMKEAANRLMVFDNCRNNPADGWRQLEAVRSASVSPEAQRSGAAGEPNTLLLFSTAPGRVARDGPAGENSPFAAVLLRHLVGGVDLQSLPSKLRRDLLIATQGRQVLWDRNTFNQAFLLNVPRNPQTAASGDSDASRSGWNSDPSRIIELPKAYAFARENGLPLPSGLIAHRPETNSPDSRKVGSFKYVQQIPAGLVPQLLVVMSVEEQRTAEIINAGIGHFNSATGNVEAGTYWRFTTAALSGSRLEYEPREGSGPFVFDWRDANSGSLTQTHDQLGGTQKRASFITTFTRLDG